MTSRRRVSTGASSPRLGLFLLTSLAALPFAGCGWTGGENGDEMEIPAQPAEARTLGPRDGQELPPTDLERVAVGTMAPDFSLRTITGETLTLSAFRGVKNVVLVFYRGHW